MQHLNPQESLERLISCRAQYESATGDRTEAERALEVAINRAEIEAGNLLGRIDGDIDVRRIYNQLLFEAEMGRGVIAQRTPVRR
jgi:hypothetical protein